MLLNFKPVTLKAKVIYFLAPIFGRWLSREEGGLIVSGYFFNKTFYPISIEIVNGGNQGA